jgi:NADH dehydrogenase
MVEKLVTVFGGSGFVGRHVVRALAGAGYRIRVGVRRPELGYFLQPLGDVGQIAVLKCDIRNETQVSPLVVNADAVVNLVGGFTNLDALHVKGARVIARAAAKARVRRLVHVSAIGASPEAKSKYARTKGQGEAAVREVFPNATILRPSIIFGPEDHFFNRFAALMRLAPVAFPLFGGGKTKFQPVYVGDVACAVVQALARHEAMGKTYELGGPKVYSFKDLLRYVAETTERKPLFIPIPFFLLDLGAAVTGWIPGAPITYDQAKLLRGDNVVSRSGVGTLAELGISPTAVEAVVPSYLWAFRPKGQYAEVRGA